METRLHYVCPLLRVFDMRASLAFYRDALGFAIVESAPPADRTRDEDLGWIWLRRDGADLMLNSAHDPDAERPPLRDPATVAAHDDTALYIGCPDVDGMYAQLRERGIATDPPTVAHYGMKQLHLKDPDGFTICFQWMAGPPAA
jgi:uncharacterized glyoxalase superfamily protein PhnB